MGDLARPAPDLAWFTEKLQGQLLEALSTGLKPRWVALNCNVAPKALATILDLGSRKDGDERFRSFVRRWTKAESELMRDKVTEWRDGSSSAFQFLKERWPKYWGPDAEPDYEALGATTTSADELAQLKEIIEAPEKFGVEHLFEEHWTRKVP